MMKCWNKNDEQNSLNDEMMKWWNSVRNWNNNSTPILVGQTWTWQRVGGTSIPYRFVTVLVYNSLLIYAAQWIYCAQRTHRSSAKQGKQTKLDTCARRMNTHSLIQWARFEPEFHLNSTQTTLKKSKQILLLLSFELYSKEYSLTLTLLFRVKLHGISQ